MNYREALEYFYNIPPFIPRKAVPGEDLFNLDAIRILLERLGNPEKKLRFIHVAGTNGKGSTCAFLRSILTACGLKTGLYTSPALEDFTDQFTIDGINISKDDTARLLTKVRDESWKMSSDGLPSPSAFEQITALSFLYFCEQNCDLVVLETGLGGRLDATNVIPAPLISVITSISLEHTEVLGDTLAKIAGEKAGIIKKGSRTIIYPQDPEAGTVFEERCNTLSVPLYHACLPEKAAACDLTGQTFYLPSFNGSSFSAAMRISLLGPYQLGNASLAADTAVLLKDEGYPITEDGIRRGLADAIWPGRFELLQTDPRVLVDGSHNPQGAETLRDGLVQYFPGKKIIFIAGVLADKQYDLMMGSVIPLAERFFTVAPDSPRALSAAALADYLTDLGCRAEACSDFEDAYQKAVNAAGPDDVICAFGSLYFVGVLRSILTT